MTTSSVLDLAGLRMAAERGEPFELRLFWGHRARPGAQLSDSCFSQWWPCRFTVDGAEYSSAEQFMMAGKARVFADEEVLGQIMAAKDPDEVKSLGRRVRHFEQAVWERARFDIVCAGNVAKFGQDEQLRKYLLASAPAVIVEASPVDTIWGIGLAASAPAARDPRTWRGLNLLGFALMRARAELSSA
jgi:ribA/ribD-fused uncharacterized protein